MLITPLAQSTAAHSIATFAAFQNDSIGSGNARLIMFFIGLTAVALGVQALVVVCAAVFAMRTQKELAAELSHFRAKANELIEKSDALVTELTPQIRSITAKVNIITGHIEHLTALAHEKADEFSPTISAANETIVAANQTVQTANLKTRAQISRVDGMVTSALNATARLGAAIELGIAKPSREIAGIAAGLKAGLDTLISGARAFGTSAPVGRATPPRPISPYRANGTRPDLDL